MGISLIWFLYLLAVSPLFLDHFIFWNIKMLLAFYFPFQPSDQPFLHGALVPINGEWYSEIKVGSHHWVIIASRLF